ncbi:MAG: peroxiredoxin [Nocardioides sp.]
MPTPGDLAPDFTLRDQFGQDVSLSGFHGRKAVALLFFPFAFSGVCTGEMAGIRDRLAEFATFETEVIGLSCDPVYALRVFADRDGLHFPLLSDFWPHGATAAAYGVFDRERGCAERTSFVIDKTGIIRWRFASPLPEARNLDDHLSALHEALLATDSATEG